MAFDINDWGDAVTDSSALKPSVEDSAAKVARFGFDSSGITLLADDLTTVLSRFGASAAEFYVDGQRVASFGADGLEIPRGRTARFGELAMVPRSTDGHVSIKWVG